MWELHPARDGQYDTPSAPGPPPQVPHPAPALLSRPGPPAHQVLELVVRVLGSQAAKEETECKEPRARKHRQGQVDLHPRPAGSPGPAPIRRSSLTSQPLDKDHLFHIKKPFETMYVPAAAGATVSGPPGYLPFRAAHCSRAMRLSLMVDGSWSRLMLHA